MSYLLEIIVAGLVTIFFISFERPKLRFLFFGYFFFMVALLLQFPFQLAQMLFSRSLEFNFLPFILPAVAIVISEMTKYFSLKRFLKTKSYKNGILFGIGWVSLESSTVFSSLFYGGILSYLGINLDASLFLGNELPLLNFLFFFLTNLAISVLIIIGIIKNSKGHVWIAIFFALIIFYGFSSLDGVQQILFAIATFVYSGYVVFKYRTLK